MRKTFKKIFILCIYTTVVSCGLKGSPLPPLTNNPAPVDKLNVKQAGRDFILYWTYEGRYEDNRKMDSFSFEIFSLDGKIQSDIKNKGNIYWTEVPIKDFENEHCFRIRVLKEDNYSDFSRYSCIYPDSDIPKKVSIFNLSIREDGILLEWKSEEKKFRIFRSNDENIPPIEYSVVKNSNEFLDRNVQIGNKFCYYISSFRDNVESYPSEIKCEVFIDIFPPEPPLKPELLKKDNEYIIIWTESPSKDVVGYYIYKNSRKINLTPIKTYYFKDKNYQKGDKYSITAVDRAGNESEPAYLSVE
ncbi:hypothetical protein [Persephonella sp.]